MVESTSSEPQKLNEWSIKKTTNDHSSFEQSKRQMICQRLVAGVCYCVVGSLLTNYRNSTNRIIAAQ